jgi:hypothetical protein
VDSHKPMIPLIPLRVSGGDPKGRQGSPLIPVIPFFTEMGQIGETGETVSEVANMLATRINTG